MCSAQGGQLPFATFLPGTKKLMIAVLEGIEKTDTIFILFQTLAKFQRWAELQSNIATTTIASTRRKKTRTTYQVGSLSGAPRIGPISLTFVRSHGITCLRKSCTDHQVGDSFTFTAEAATWQIWATTKPQLPH